MPRYQVTGFLREAPFRGEYEVSTREEAIDRAYLATGPLLRLTEVCKLTPADMETRAATTNNQTAEQAKEIERLRAENERLRAALIRMVDAVEKKGGPRQRAALTDAFVHALNVLDKKKGDT